MLQAIGAKSDPEFGPLCSLSIHVNTLHIFNRPSLTSILREAIGHESGPDLAPFAKSANYRYYFKQKSRTTIKNLPPPYITLLQEILIAARVSK